MSTFPLMTYPLDPTGTNTNNLVQNEAHTLTANRTYRAIAPLYGAFFADSMQVIDAATGKPLTDGTNGTVEQFYCCEYYELPSERYGFEIDAIVIITDPTVSNNVIINYQCLGGPYSTCATAIVQQIEALALDQRPVAWGDIIGKPSQFPPSFHLHDIGDVYGFEYVTHALDRIRDAILVGDQASHDIIYAYIDAAIGTLQNAQNGLQAELTNHINDTNNPHKTTAAETGAYSTGQVDTMVSTLNNTIATDVSNLQAQINANNNTDAAQQVQINNLQTSLTNQVNKEAADVQTLTTNLNTAVTNLSTKEATDVQSLTASINATNTNLQTQVNKEAADVSNLQAQINGKQPVGNYLQYGQANAVVGNGFVVQGVETVNGTLYVNGTISCSGDIWAFNSDERLKILTPLTNVMEKLRTMSGYHYRYRPEAVKYLGDLGVQDRDYIGYSAQEWERNFPETTGLAQFDKHPETGESMSGENFLTIQYEKTAPVILEGLKEVDATLNALIDILGVREQVDRQVRRAIH